MDQFCCPKVDQIFWPLTSILSKTTEFQQRRNFKEYKGFKDIYMGSVLQEINEKVKPIKTPLPNGFNQ